MPARKKPKPNPPEPAAATKATTKASISNRSEPSDVVGDVAESSAASAKTQENGTPAQQANDASGPGSIKEKEVARDEDQNKPPPVISSREDDTPMLDAEGQPRAVPSWYGTWQRNPVQGTPSIKSEKQIPPPSPGPSAPSSSQRALATPPRRGPTSHLATSHLSPGASSRSLPLTSTTKLNIASDGSTQSPEPSKAESLAEKDSQVAKTASDQHVNDVQPSSASIASARTTQPASIKRDQTTADTPPPWKSWFGKQKPEPQVSNTEHKQSQPSVPETISDKGKEDPKGLSAKPELSLDSSKAALQTGVPDIQEGIKTQATDESAPQSRSWLSLWSGGKPSEEHQKLLEDTEGGPSATKSSQDGSPAARLDTEKPKDGNDQPKGQKIAAQGNENNTGWAFWSRAPANASTGDSGELAVAGSSSQSQPENAFCEQDGVPKSVSTPTGTKRGRPMSLEVVDDAKSISSRKSMPVPLEKKAAELATDIPPPRTPPQRPVSRKDDQKHLLLPLFSQTYPVEPESPNFLQQIGRLFYGKPVASKYPMRLREPHRIKNALAVGVHGYFPTAFMQTVLGRPTGTSVKFAEEAAQAIHRYAEKHQHTPVSVEKIALEGEGRIEERLDLLWKLLLNWIDKIRHADFIILACHSQGVPVAISLAAKLIGFGCVNGARLGVCAMAGVNLGPFVDYRSRFIGGSAGELFEFAKPDSPVSKAYENALDTVLRFGAKVIYIGSMDDQLVSLQSSTFGSAEHPSIYRAVWIDGRVHMADFLTHLVGFALKLRNLGVTDHGLIRELSNPLAGSLVGGEGHSRIYEDDAVYDLAIEYTAGTTSLHTHVLKIDKGPSVTSTNPYILPFAMRGVLEEEFVRTELADEALQLLKQFDEWKPTTKVLRDVKYRLEGIRSKL